MASQTPGGRKCFARRACIVMSLIFLLWLCLTPLASAQLTFRVANQNLAELRRLRAVVVVDPDDPSIIRSVAFPWGVEPIALDLLLRFRRVESVSFEGGYRVDDQLIAKTCRLRGLQSLNLGGTSVTDSGLIPVGRVTTLKQLYLWRTLVSDRGTAHLKNLVLLEVLNLWDTPTTDWTVTEVLPHLRLRKVLLGTSPQPKTIFHDKWELPGSDITAETAAAFQKSHPRTEVVFWDVNDSPETPSRVNAVPASQELVVRPGNSDHALMAQRQGDWNSFLGARTNGNAVNGPGRMDWTTSTPALLWQRESGRGLSAPSVAQGRVVYTERLGDVFRILCLEAATGRECWVAEGRAAYTDALGYDDGPRSTPAIHNGLVYCYSAEGTLHCLRLSDGRLVWSCDTAEQYGVKPNLYGVGSSPVVSENTLLVVVGGIAENYEKRQPGIVAFDLQTGLEVYRVAGGRASYASIRTFVVDGKRLGVGFLREGLVIFDTRTGDVIARQPWAAGISGCVNAMTPVIYGNQIFISEAYGPGSCLTELLGNDESPLQLQTIWQDPPKSRQRSIRTHWATPIYHNGFLYGCSGRHSANGELRCIEWETGKVVWRKSLRQLSSMCRVDDQLINLTEDGQLQLITLNSAYCDAQRSFRPGVNGRNDPFGKDPLLKYPVWTAPVVSDTILYVRGKDRLAAFQLASGN